MTEPLTTDILAAVAPGKDPPPAASIPTAPIAVSNSAVPSGVWAGVRYALAIAIPYAAGKGWIGPSDGAQITGLVISLVPAAWGVYSAIRSHNVKALFEPFVPASVSVKV